MDPSIFFVGSTFHLNCILSKQDRYWNLTPGSWKSKTSYWKSHFNIHMSLFHRVRLNTTGSISQLFLLPIFIFQNQFSWSLNTISRLLSVEIPEKESDNDRVVSSHHQTTNQEGKNNDSSHCDSLIEILPVLHFFFFLIWGSLTIPLPNIHSL